MLWPVPRGLVPALGLNLAARCWPTLRTGLFDSHNRWPLGRTSLAATEVEAEMLKL